jgi:hypothetical protein
MYLINKYYLPNKVSDEVIIPFLLQPDLNHSQQGALSFHNYQIKIDTIFVDVFQHLFKIIYKLKNNHEIKAYL